MGNKNGLLFIAMSFVAAVVLIIGCFFLPIGYYTFLRIVVFIVAVINLYVAYKRDFFYAMVINGVSAVLFNPIIPVYLHNKTFWMIIDIELSIWFILQGIWIIRSKRNK